MSAFPILKLLTAVSIVLGTSFGWAEGETEPKADSATTKMTREECELKKTAEFTEECSTNKTKYPTAESQSACETLASNRAKRECSPYDSKSDKREEENKCKTSFKEYNDVRAKAKEACAAFEKTSEKDSDCAAKIDSCKKKIDKLAQPYDVSEDSETASENNSTMQSIANSAVKLFGGNPNGAGNVAGTNAQACVKSIDRNARKTDKKEKDRDRRDLNEKIKKQNDEMTKNKEDLNKETNTIKEKSAELEAENKKESLKKDVKMREEIAKISKNTVELGTRLRKIGTAISKKTQDLQKVNFDYQTVMLELTDEKINQRCKQEFESLKASMINSRLSAAPPNASPDEKKQYEALAQMAAAYKSKGIKGTGEMKDMLLAARKACFESANTKKNKNKMVNSQAVKNIQDEMDELKNSMNDEKKNAELDGANIKKIQDETDKEKSQEEKEKLEKLANLNEKLQNFVTTTTEKITSAKKEIDRLNAEIAKLAVVEKFEVEDAYSEAEEAIGKSSLPLSAAIKDCKCYETDSKGKTTVNNKTENRGICSQLIIDEKTFDKKRAAERTKK